ncbi:ribosomal protein L16 [Acrasis kona]|uniref:Ribosomal protein L16 n=1 Tax=Acrasis kona TaxID=1008807 RepID=A0AAW2YX18_9EUKA
MEDLACVSSTLSKMGKRLSVHLSPTALNEGAFDFHHYDCASKSNCLFVNQRMAIICLKNYKKKVSLLIYSCICDLVILERISTFIKDGSSTRVYVFNKKPVGDETLDLVMREILGIPQYEKKTVEEIVSSVKEKSGKKLYSMIMHQLELKGITKASKRLLSTSYELVDESYFLDITNQVLTALNAFEDGLYSKNGIQPDLYAMVCLDRRRSNNNKAKIRDYDYQRVTKMMDDFDGWNIDIMTKATLERISHIVVRYNK